MKILTYGYYDDFANFFLNLRDYHQKLYSNTEYSFLTPNLSGYNTWSDANKFLLNPSLFGTANFELSELEFTEITALYTLQAKEHNIKHIKKKCSLVNDILNTLEPDIIIISGDVRPNPKIISILAKKKGIPVLFFEQGPLKTTLISKSGVTANHIPYLPLGQIKKKKPYSFIMKKYNPYRIKRLWDLLQIFTTDPETEFNFLSILRRYSKKSHSQSYVNIKKRRILFSLQVPNDINWIFHSNFHNISQLMKYLSMLLPNNIDVVFREHPMFQGSYDNELYTMITLRDNFYLDGKATVEWGKYDAMITVNSLMTFEAISAAVPVGLLGKSCYANMATDCSSYSKLSLFVSKVLAGECKAPSNEEQKHYIKNSFISGHFRAITTELLHQIVMIIEEEK